VDLFGRERFHLSLFTRSKLLAAAIIAQVSQERPFPWGSRVQAERIGMAHIRQLLVDIQAGSTIIKGTKFSRDDLNPAHLKWQATQCSREVSW
jgi:hypothetical protein